MTRILAWLGHHGVNVLAVVAALAVIATTLLATVGSSIVIEPDRRPLVYDLGLAYLAGWTFHLLVVSIPNRRKEVALLTTLRGPLMMIANSGMDLVRDLEYLGRCPERPITPEHVELVCRANNYNTALTDSMATRLSYSREAFATVVPYLTSLQPELAMALQRANDNFLHSALNVSGKPSRRIDWQPSDVRQEQVVWQLPPGGPRTAKRATFQGWHNLVWKYYEETENVRTLLDQMYSRRSLTRSEGTIAPERIHFWINHMLNEPGYPFADYPSTAYSDDLTSPPRESPPDRA